MSNESPTRSVGSIAATISNGVVHALADTIGRGPTKARAHISQDLIAVVLRDYMTKSEKALVADGQSEIVLAGRRAIQESMRQKLVGVIEDATGRNVEAFFSDNRTHPDMAVEVFVLVPLADHKDGNHKNAATLETNTTIAELIDGAVKLDGAVPSED
jgi:uncharacterized protein YbcI